MHGAAPLPTYSVRALGPSRSPVGGLGAWRLQFFFPMKSVLLPILALAAVSAAHAGVTVVGPSPEGSVYRAEVPYLGFARINDPQRQPEWCWAASVSDVFRYYGHPISQETIVRAVYGTTVNLPAFSSEKIAELLNRDWKDDNGKRFRSRLTAAYDALAGVNAINNAIMIENLRASRPLVVCNTHHCMVITEATFTQFRVLSVGVFDPWPYGPMTHDLPPLELVPAQIVLPNGQRGQLMFVAAVEVTDLPSSDGDDPPGASGGGGDAADAGVAGDWAGIIQTPMGGLHFVLHATGDDDDLSATADSPDQGASDLPVDEIKLHGKVLSFRIDAWDIAYRGTVKGDHISGTFRQRGVSMPLRLEKSSD